MGIKQLMQLINEKASDAIQSFPLERYSGEKVACDASMAIYQFLLSTQHETKTGLFELTDSEGNSTAHLAGLFNRSISLMEKGVKPIWVFDGKPPDLKAAELAKRRKAKREAHAKLEEAREEGNLEEMLKYKQQSLHLTQQMTEDAQTMLRLMGFPVVLAPGEAEAQCASLVKAGIAKAVVSEDMDSLPLGASYMLRGINSKSEPVREVCLEEVLRGLKLNQEEFIDLCILMGCDYTQHINGVGPATAYKLISKHRNIQNALRNLREKNHKKTTIPEDFDFQAAKMMFTDPLVLNPTLIDIAWKTPDRSALLEFLTQNKNFSLPRVDSGLKKLQSALTKPTQLTMDKLFGRPIVTKRKLLEPKPNKRTKRSNESIHK